MSTDERIMKERQRVAGEGEEMFTRRRSVREDGSGSGFKHNIPEAAVDLLNIEIDDTAVIEIHDDHYIVTFE